MKKLFTLFLCTLCLGFAACGSDNDHEGDDAFLNCGVKVLTSRNPTPPAVGFKSFDWTTHEEVKVYVPRGSKAAYEKAEGWKEFKEIIEE